MLGPSGFFQNIGDTDFPDKISGLELIYDSEDGFNVLYRVCKNGRFFVYKALKPEYKGNHLYEELLKKDFNIGFSLNHPNICQYYGMVDLPSIGNCIVMEWVDGCSLDKLMAKGRLSRPLARKIICEICGALGYMHKKQIVHRDLKPHNILVTYNGQNVKLIDFGLSDTDSYNVFKAPAGTRLYASPELLTGGQVDGRTDIWSLGIIIKEMGVFSRVASGCLHRNKERRFSCMEDVCKAVLHSGRRYILWSLSLLCLLFISVGLLWIYDREAIKDNDSLEVSQINHIADTLTTVQSEPEIIPEVKESSENKNPVYSKTKESTPFSDDLDSEMLDDLFQETFKKIN